MLVDQRALHVDVAEKDSVEGVAEQEIEALLSGDRSDFGHAEARRVVRETYVTPELQRLLIERLAHRGESLRERTLDLGRVLKGLLQVLLVLLLIQHHLIQIAFDTDAPKRSLVQ